MINSIVLFCKFERLTDLVEEANDNCEGHLIEIARLKAVKATLEIEVARLKTVMVRFGNELIQAAE